MISRDRYLQKVVDYMWDGQIKVIAGIRRCGKSTLLFHLFYNYLLGKGVKAESIIQLELDKRKDAKYRNPLVLAEFVETQVKDRRKKYYLFIDEIQFCYAVPDPDNAGHEITVYDLLNELKDYKNLDVYVTGSNSKMLSKDIATEFRGRASQIQVYPLSFSEYNNYKGGSARDNLDTYMVYGGMPYLLKLKNPEQRKKYLSSLFDEVYIKDIVERNKVERSDILGNILDNLSSQISSLTNPTNITNALKNIKNEKLSVNTVSDYIDYCEDAFIVSEAKRYDVKGKHYFDYPNKYYFVDVGLRNARLNFRQIDPGHLMENIVYNELLSRGDSVDVGVVVDRRKGVNAQKEIDFVVNDGDRRLYIQSAWQMNTDEKINTELDSLKLAKDFFSKIIIQNDIPETFRDDDGILHVKLTEFLLNPEILR